MSTATRWAKYQVLPTAADHHQTVPVANRIVVRIRTDGRIGSRPSIQYAIPTPAAASRIPTPSWSANRPNSHTNGTSTRAGSGGNGSSARPSGTPLASVSG